MNTNEKQNAMVAQLRSMLQDGVVTFTYQKANGEIREAHGTTKMDIIPTEDHPKGTGVVVNTNIRYYDTDKSAWRSFRTESLCSVDGHNPENDEPIIESEDNV